jgi:hypothetical protein
MAAPFPAGAVQEKKVSKAPQAEAAFKALRDTTVELAQRLMTVVPVRVLLHVTMGPHTWNPGWGSQLVLGKRAATVWEAVEMRYWVPNPDPVKLMNWFSPPTVLRPVFPVTLVTMGGVKLKVAVSAVATFRYCCP